MTTIVAPPARACSTNGQKCWLATNVFEPQIRTTPAEATSSGSMPAAWPMLYPSPT